MLEDYSAHQPIATWNSVRGVWETTEMNLFCEHSGLYSDPLPTSGTMRNGLLYPRAQQAHHTDENEYSLLRTPAASEGERGHQPEDVARARGGQVTLSGQFLPTPTVSDQYTGNLASTQQSEGSMHSVTLAQVVNRPDLMPTPSTMDHLPARTPEKIAESKERTPAGYSNLREKVVNDWGRFAEAIARWETVNGTAPAPTEPYGDDGKHRLSARFAEWMMGLPAGWVTDCNITRNEQLKACGNGVVPQQATLALKLLGAHNVIQNN